MADNNKYEPSESEISAKKRERDYQYERMKDAENRIRDLRAQKAQLEKAKAVLVRENSNFQRMMSYVNNSDMKTIKHWKGVQYDKVYKGDAVKFSDFYVRHSNQPINKALDKLNWAINDIQSQINSQEGIWGTAKNLWNSAKTWLENLWN